MPTASILEFPTMQIIVSCNQINAVLRALQRQKHSKMNFQYPLLFEVLKCPMHAIQISTKISIRISIAEALTCIAFPFLQQIFYGT